MILTIMIVQNNALVIHPVLMMLHGCVLHMKCCGFTGPLLVTQITIQGSWWVVWWYNNTLHVAQWQDL